MVFQLITGRDDDFKLEFGLSPVLSATLGEYDSYDDERPSLEEILNHSRMMADSDISVDWSSLERKYVGRSPLYLEVVRHYKEGDRKGKTRRESFQDLIENPDDIQGWSPLLWAAYTGRRNEVEELLDYGADPLKTAQVKRNIYHYAAESANPEALELLLRRGYHKTSGALSAHDIWGETPLHIASARSAESVKLLLDHGAQIGSLQNTGELPLHYVSHLSGEARLSTLQNLLNHLEPKSQLLNSINHNGQPCLFYCLDTPKCVEVLLQWGADVTVVDRKGRNALHHACFKNHSESLSYLLRHCPVEMVTAVDAEGDTPIFVGFKNKAVDCALMMLRRHYHPPDIVDRKGRTLLHHAAELNDQSITNYVVSIPGLDRNARTRDGRTAYDIANEKNCILAMEESMERASN
jgi:ankyrin repeat protein